MNPTAPFPLLAALDDGERQGVITAMRRQKVSDGQVIYERGEDCTDAFFIFDGAVKFCTYGPTGDMAYFYHRRPGDIFGFHSAITGLQQTTTATASGDAVLGRMTSAAFMDLVLGHREVSKFMLVLVTNLLRAETGRVTQLITMDAPARVAAELLNHVASSGSNTVHPPARADMAARLGMTRETLARHLSDLSKKGIITLERDSIVIPDVQQLADLI